MEQTHPPQLTSPEEPELQPQAPILVRIGTRLRHRSLVTGLVLAGGIVLLCVAAPLLTHYDPIAQDANSTLLNPSSNHWMGTDEYGRDLFSRVLYGGRITLSGSFALTLIGALIGSTLGLIAGYAGGAIGMVIMRLMDFLLVFPGILLALVVAAVLGPGLINEVFAIAIVSVPIYGRVVEGGTIEVRHKPFMDAAMALGASPSYIIRRHVLPNTLPQILVLVTSWLGAGTLFIAGLGFLGLGPQPPTPEWGTSLNEGRDFMSLAWWITFFPGLFLALFSVGINLVGDGVRDVQDPTLSKF